MSTATAAPKNTTPAVPEEIAQAEFTDIFIVVHGIGSQSRFATVRSVATRLADSQMLTSGAAHRPVAPQPLGFFHTDVKSLATALTAVCLLDDPERLKGTDLAAIGFAEVFWADIPEEVNAEGRTLEETKAWARTVVARAKALCLNKGTLAEEITPPDFGLAAEVLDEIVDTVAVLENLTFLGEKAGLFKFNLREVLEAYLGDVQLVTEFSEHRIEIVRRFHVAMEDIHREYGQNLEKPVRLHVVAHSEGTVISFLGLLSAMSGHTLKRPDPDKKAADQAPVDATPVVPAWLKAVRGFMTIGSPIDKHLLLWPRLWTTRDPVKSGNNDASAPVKAAPELNPAFANNVLKPRQIAWRNYYDYGDPVGFELDTARRWLAAVKAEAFDFCGCPRCNHDMGFARYLLPGEAHNEYWNDPEVFEHFVAEVVKGDVTRVFTLRDLAELEVLATHLKCPKCHVSVYLHPQFSEKTRELLAAYTKGPDLKLQAALVADFNRIIATGPLYEHVRFKGIKLSEPTKKLLADQPAGTKLARLNRALLADAYDLPQRLPVPPPTKPRIAIWSPTLPFVFSALLLLIGVFILHKFVNQFTNPNLDPVEQYFRFMLVPGMTPLEGSSGWQLLTETLGISGLIAGATLMARFPRLAGDWPWKAWGLLAMIIGCGIYVLCVPHSTRAEIGAAFRVVHVDPTLGACLLAFVTGIVGFLLTRPKPNAERDRKQRWLGKGMRPLIICGAVAILCVVGPRVYTFQKSGALEITPAERAALSPQQIEKLEATPFSLADLKQLAPAGSTNRVVQLKSLADLGPIVITRLSVWPVVLASVAFLYLWWLSALVFDLAFVWQRYIRQSTAVDRLRTWQPAELRPSLESDGKTEKCRYPGDYASGSPKNAQS